MHKYLLHQSKFCTTQTRPKHKISKKGRLKSAQSKKTRGSHITNAQQRRKITFDLYHQVIIQDRDFDLNKYIMDLAFKLQELSSSLQSLMFELEENPAPTKTIDSIMKRMSRIIKITMDHHRGGLSHHIKLLAA